MTYKGYMTLEYWEEITPNMAKVIRSLPIIWDAPDSWWFLKVVDGFVIHTASLKAIGTYA